MIALTHFSLTLLVYCDLWGVVKICLILSHGQTAVDSGFSFNQDMPVENIYEKSTIAQRQVYGVIDENVMESYW